MFTLKIELGNDAMRSGKDVAKALREVADTLAMFEANMDLVCADPYDRAGTIMDSNGNRIGSWKVGRP